MTRPQGYPITPPAGSPAQQNTLFGVPAGPHEEPTKPAAPSPLAPPPIPMNRTQHLPITPRPPAPPQMPSPASTQPLAPATPIAPPTAPTLMALDLQPAAASTAKGMGPAHSQMDLPPATTARGIQPPPVAPAAPPPRSPVVIEVTPRSLGIGTVAGFCEELIRRNSKLPTETRKLFTTSRDSQDIVRIVVCQGESRRLDNNVVIGDLRLENLPPRPRGETSIEVTFALDASGILNVRARDAQTGKEQSAQLDVVGSVPQQDVAGARERIQQLRR
jgi:molecular chaperone DnaK